MPTGGDAALGYASRLDEIGFPEFTTKLVSDTFDALIAADIRQQQAFIELLRETSKTLSSYIADTKDDIGPEEVLPFLSAVLPPADADADSPPTKLAVGSSLAAADVTTLNDALEVTDAGVASDNKVAESGNVTQPRYDAILNAVAVRIAANKYTLLTEMVKQGMLRLVVDDGTIETRLNFRAYGSDYFRANSASMSRSEFNFRAAAKSGGLVSLWVKASASTSYNSVRVSTSSTSSGSNSGVTVDIFGGVKINFHTDYLPLNPNG
ncbi:hypothetical protein [Microbacterium sp.]|uniref:hypothetical protein n=1 Tax=Microbacterium sp. TaxID=51671 RepID=UPI003A86E4CC